MALQHVVSSVVVDGRVRKEKAWSILTRFETLHEVMSSVVDKVSVQERTEREGKSEWFVTIDGAPMTWIEKDTFNHSDFDFSFKSLYGDFETLFGSWKIADHMGSGIKVGLNVSFNMGIPIIDDMLGDGLCDRMRESMESMLSDFSRELRNHQTEDRRFERFPVLGRVSVDLGGIDLDAFLVNFSAGGMMFRYRSMAEFNSTSVSEIRFGGFSFPIAHVHHDLSRRSIRVAFSRMQTSKAIEAVLATVERSVPGTHDAFTGGELHEEAPAYLVAHR